MKRMFRMDAHIITGIYQCTPTSWMLVPPKLLHLRISGRIAIPHFVEWTSFAISSS